MISELTIVFLALALVVGRPAPTGRMPIAGHGAGPSEPAQHRPRDGPATTDHNRCASDIALFAACVTAGLPPALAAATVADTYPSGASPWHTTAALLALGAHPERAWSELRPLPGGADLADLVTLSNASGTALANGCTRIAERLRSTSADAATAKAERAGVLIAIPLTAFFLPAFFVLGLAPVVISLGADMLN